MNNVLGVVPLQVSDWALVFCFGFAMMAIVEVVKFLERCKRRIASR
jgi:hypothetical protein